MWISTQYSRRFQKELEEGARSLTQTIGHLRQMPPELVITSEAFASILEDIKKISNLFHVTNYLAQEMSSLATSSLHFINDHRPFIENQNSLIKKTAVLIPIGSLILLAGQHYAQKENTDNKSWKQWIPTILKTIGISCLLLSTIIAIKTSFDHSKFSNSSAQFVSLSIENMGKVLQNYTSSLHSTG